MQALLQSLHLGVRAVIALWEMVQAVIALWESLQLAVPALWERVYSFGEVVQAVTHLWHQAVAHLHQAVRVGSQHSMA